MFEKIKKWWHGEDIVHENKPSDPFFVIGWYNKKHWTSRVAHSVVNYVIKHQTWIIPTLITLVASIILARPWKW